MRAKTAQEPFSAVFLRLVRALHPLAAATVVVLVCVQIYLIATYIFGSVGALHAHMAVGHVVVGIEVLVFLTGIIGFRHDRTEVRLSTALVVVGALQAELAADLGHSPQVHAFHGLLAVAVLLLAWRIAARTRSSI